MNAIDLTSLKVITLSDIEAAAQQSATEVAVGENAILTPSALEALKERKIALRKGSVPPPGNGSQPSGLDPARIALFNSPEAQAVKEEIVAVGKKLWMRQYVDGNGGNISQRIGPNEVICTPTLRSKADLRPEDLCLVDLDGKQLCGGRPRTSEILLHLEIYKEVPEAKAVVHCHPPHATAYAITGKVPPTCVIPEYEVFIGKVAISPYKTPGTSEFAQTVLPYVRNHNTVLLANHGIVCWGDTVTHAEWYVEVTDTYCWTLMLAGQLGSPITHISGDQVSQLLDIKKTLGLPDPRHDMKECTLCDIPETEGGITVEPRMCVPGQEVSRQEMDSIVQAVTDEVMKALSRKS